MCIHNFLCYEFYALLYLAPSSLIPKAFYFVFLVGHTVKVWDGLWRLCSTFVGHRGVITCLAPYAYLPCIMSGSMDATIRVWNLETLDQVQK